MFREVLTELERLIDVRGSLLLGPYGTTAIEDGITYTLKLLPEFDVNTSESSVIEELERLVEMRSRVVAQFRRRPSGINYLRHLQLFDKMIDSKIDCIKIGSLSRLVQKRGVEPMAALERLAAVQGKLNSRCVHDLLESKIREIVWKPRAKASFRHDFVVRRYFY